MPPILVVLMTANERQFKAYGYVRIGLYALVFFFSALMWSILVLTVLPRLLPFLRLLATVVYFGIAAVFLLAALTAFWVVNRVLIVPTLTRIMPDGFKTTAPYRQNVAVHFAEIGTIFELGFGTLVTVRSKRHHRNYSIIFGKDTDGYHRLIDTLKDGLNEFRARR